MSSKKRSPGLSLILKRKSTQRHKTDPEDKAGREEDTLQNFADLSDYVGSPKTRATSRKEVVRIPEVVPKSPRTPKKAVGKVNGKKGVSLESHEKGSKRLQDKSSCEQKLSIKSTPKSATKGKSSVEESLLDSPKQPRRSKRNASGDGQSESARHDDIMISTPKGAKELSGSGNNRGTRINGHSQMQNGDSDSGDDFYYTKTKSTPTKKVVKKAAGRNTPKKDKEMPASENALNGGATPKTKVTLKHHQELKSTPKKPPEKVSSDSSRTPSPCFHLWPPRNV